MFGKLFIQIWIKNMLEIHFQLPRLFTPTSQIKNKLMWILRIFECHIWIQLMLFFQWFFWNSHENARKTFKSNNFPLWNLQSKSQISDRIVLMIHFFQVSFYIFINLKAKSKNMYKQGLQIGKNIIKYNLRSLAQIH